MYGLDMLDYYKLVAKRNWVFIFLKESIGNKMQTKIRLLKKFQKVGLLVCNGK